MAEEEVDQELILYMAQAVEAVVESTIPRPQAVLLYKVAEPAEPQGLLVAMVKEHMAAEEEEEAAPQVMEDTLEAIT